MENLTIISVIAFFVQSAFVLALHFRIKQMEKVSATDKRKDNEDKNVKSEIQTEEEKKSCRKSFEWH